MRPFLVEAPEGPVVAWEDPDGLAAQCGLEPDDERAELVVGFEQAAVSYLDGYTGRLSRCLLRQKWALPLIGTPEIVLLPFPDCRDFAIEQLTDDVWSAVENVSFQHDRDQVRLIDLPNDLDNLHLTCIAGWESAEHVPPSLKQAIRMLTSHWFDNRSAVHTGQVPHEVPLSVQALLSPFVHVGA